MLRIKGLGNQNISENLIALSLFFPSLYFCLANLLKGYLMLYFASFVVGIISYFIVLKRKTILFLTVPFFIILAVAYSSINNPRLLSLILNTSNLYEFSKSRIVLLYLVYLPPMMLLLSQRIDFKVLLDKLFVCSILILPLAIIINYNRMLSSRTLDYMTISYQLLLWSLFALFWTVSNKRRWPWIIIIPAVISIIVGGSRGAAICVVLTIALLMIFRCFVFNENKKDFKKVILILSVIVLAILFIVFFNQMLTWVDSILNSFGIRSRVVSELLLNGFLRNEDRMGLIGAALPHLFDHILGYGVYGDRFMLNASYVHNFFIELLIDYGVFLGGVIVVGLISISMKAFKVCLRNRNEIVCYYLIISIILIYVKFMISASYLESAECLMSCGILYNIIKYNRDCNLSNQF